MDNQTSAPMQPPTPVLTAARPGSKRNFPAWVVILTLIVSVIALSAIVYLLFGLVRQKSNDQRAIKKQGIALNLAVATGTKITDGNYTLDYSAWSPGSDKLLLTMPTGTTAMGGPAEIDYYVFDLKQKALVNGYLSADPILAYYHVPIWQNDTKLVAQEKSVDVTDPSNIKVTVSPTSTVSSGFGLLDQVTFTNPNDHKTSKAVEELSFSPDGKYAAFISTYGRDPVKNYGSSLFLIPKDAKSLNELINLGDFDPGPEMITPNIKWTDDGRYLLVGNDEIYDVLGRSPILGVNTDRHFRTTYLSPDQSKALVFSFFQDRTEQQDYDHVVARAYIKNLSNGQETELLSAQGSDTEILNLDGSFSPDGKYVVFYYDKLLWVADVMTGEKRQLTSAPKFYRQPRWSPDGKSIAYTSNDGVYLLGLSEGK